MTAETSIASTVPEPFGKPSGPGLWHVKGMELPAYIQHIAHDLLESGHAKSVGQAIQMAVGIVKKWAAGIPTGGGASHKHVHPDVRAVAAKAVAEWEAKRATAHSRHHTLAGGMHMSEVDLTRHPKEVAEGYADPQTLAAHYDDVLASFGPDHPITRDIARHTASKLGGASGVKRKLTAHLRNVHRLTGSHEHQTLPQLHEKHAADHASGKIPHHAHVRELEPRIRHQKTAELSFGVQLTYDAWGRPVQPIDLATSTVQYPNGSRVVHHSEGDGKKIKGTRIGFRKLVARLVAKGHTVEEARAIAAEIGRRKYGTEKFAAMGKKGRRSAG